MKQMRCASKGLCSDGECEHYGLHLEDENCFRICSFLVVRSAEISCEEDTLYMAHRLLKEAT